MNMKAAQMYSWRRMASTIIQMVKRMINRTHGFRKKSWFRRFRRPGIREGEVLVESGGKAKYQMSRLEGSGNFGCLRSDQLDLWKICSVEIGVIPRTCG